MKKFPLIVCLITILCAGFVSCIDNESDEYWKKYKSWREDGQKWLEVQSQIKNDDGSFYYQKVTPSWDKSSYVYIHYFNDTTLTRGNLSPLYTSTVDTKYIGYLHDGTAFDSSYLSTSPADSIFRTQLQSVINGWTIALDNMHVGDSCEVLIPYEYAYGESGSGTKVPPYSALRFCMKLVDISNYETRPE